MVIIPAYNPPSSFKVLLDNLLNIKFIDKIIVVDDGSSNDFNYVSKDIIYIRNEKNMGKGFALRKAIEYAKPFNFNNYIFLDCDLVVDFIELKEFLTYIRDLERYDVIIGYPNKVKKKGFGILKLITKLVLFIYTKRTIKYPLSGQRIYKKLIIDHIVIKENRYGIELSMTIDILNKNYKILEVPFNFNHNEKGKDLKSLLHKAKQLKDILNVALKKWWE
ncbi:glycosyltransferase family 2 protein [Caldicellulosiruptoraceae bacterium PP1]